MSDIDREVVKQAVRDVLFEMMEMPDMFPELQEKFDKMVEGAWNRAQARKAQQQAQMRQQMTQGLEKYFNEVYNIQQQSLSKYLGQAATPAPSPLGAIQQSISSKPAEESITKSKLFEILRNLNPSK